MPAPRLLGNGRRAPNWAAALLLLLWLTGCAPATPTRPATTMLHVLPDAGARPLLRALDGATRSIDLEVYLLSHREIADALRAARARGARVRVLLEQRPFGGGEGNERVAAELARGGVETRWTSRQFALTHTKALVLDGSSAWVMTANLTNAAFRQNREYLAVLTEPGDVAELANVFEADWQTGPAPTPERLVVSPVNARARLLELIEGAKGSLDVEAEELLDRRSIDALAAAARRGVSVRLVMSPPGPGERDQSAGGRAALAAAGARVRLLQSPYVHAKSILADNERLYVGSINLSSQSMDQNREIGTILTSPPAIRLAADTFERDWAAAQ